MPSDMTGTEVIEEDKTTGQRNLRFVPGPIFANIILADEINRSPAKVQSALLEAMEEHTVTIGEHTYPLDDPFLVLATQNPIDQEGTYPLPEAQVDRFMLKLSVDYPTGDEELQIMRRMSSGAAIEVNPVVTPEEIIRARRAAELISYGASPRATICLAKASRAHAFLQRRGFVTPDDVRAIGMDVLRHRVLVTYEAEAEEVEPEDIVRRILDSVEVP
jgi:MoxR-like ATPase